MSDFIMIALSMVAGFAFRHMLCLDEKRVKEVFDKRLAASDARTKELREELADWAHCKGCFCGHPACRTCKETKDALAMCGKDWMAARPGVGE